ncbi:glycosyltransferase family 4 protein [Sphingomonas crusticola]|uniref:glycosyltransferase family 4 protein n=1 Tax=Sphingomonas crusticola TaxID=1697973 RepID=UPI000E23948F|nr:glycosyltransferase family 4 protein [Sphingomonas crusticola]
MQIAYVINSLEGGGASAPVPAVVRLLQAQGHRVEILALTPRDLRGLPAILEAGLKVAVREGGQRDHLAALRWLDQQILHIQPDVIWTSLTRATLIGQIVGQMHGIDVVSWQHAAYLKPANRWLLKARQGRSLLWLADSNNVAELTHRRLGVALDRIAVWPLFAADENAPRAVPWRPGQPIRIGSLGRLHPVKGYDVLIAALARLRDGGFEPPAPIEVRIAGEGDQYARLAAQAAQARLPNLGFAGFVEPHAFLADLHLYVQPSRSEGLCIAAHEAMQAGLPVLASAVGELPYTIVNGITGHTVPPADPETLAKSLAQMLRAPDQLAVMGNAGRMRVLDLFGGAAFAGAGIKVSDRVREVRRRRMRAADRSTSPVRNGRPA